MSTPRQLFLIRHAKSSWKDETLADIVRPLNRRGNRDAPEMGQRLLARGIRPQVIATSPAVRAHTTANIIAEQLQFEGTFVVDSELYGASPDEVLGMIRKLDPEVHCAIFVGHNPGLTELANVWADEEIDNVPTCGIVAVQLADWCVPTDGQLVDFDYPKRAFEGP